MIICCYEWCIVIFNREDIVGIVDVDGRFVFDFYVIISVIEGFDEVEVEVFEEFGDDYLIDMGVFFDSVVYDL